jgi:phospholipid/cholesterol/gamma-HCH transport system substrate-binding protein
METSSGKHIKTGVFVIVTLLLFIIGLYNIGGKRRVFESTVKLSAIFRNVNGLLPGNNVRFGGIDIGTVSRIDIISDTVIKAEFSIEPKSSAFITSTSIASIGTDGLMGNKIVNIGPGSTKGISLKEGEVIKTLPLVELDNAMRTLNKTNDNLEIITDDAKIVMNRFSSKNTFWSLLMDTAVADNVKQVIVSFKISSRNAEQFTNSLNEIAGRINEGKGGLGELIRDTSLAGNLHQAAADIRATGKNAVNITNDLNEITRQVWPP